MRRLESGDLPRIAEQLTMGDPSEWTHMHASDFHRMCIHRVRPQPSIRSEAIDRLILHYGIHRPMINNRANDYGKDKALDLLRLARKLHL